MCGRYFRKSDKQRIAEAFHLEVFENLPLEVAPSYNIAPTTMQPVIRNNRDTGEREMVAMRWGMVPHFAKSLADFKGFSTINAKAETLLSKPLWRVPFHRRRCLIPADGFYEWKRLDEKTKQPYAIAMKDQSLFAFAGLWDRWRAQRPDEEDVQSCTIVTSRANEFLAPIHSRMPIVLSEARAAAWLASEPLVPAGKRTRASARWPLSTSVNRSRISLLGSPMATVRVTSVVPSRY